MNEDDIDKTTSENFVDDCFDLATKDSDKVEVIFKAIADGPVLKKKKFKVNLDTTIRTLVQKLRNMIKLETDDEQLFLFINQTFAPSLDQNVKNLYSCYQTDGTLVLYYSKTQVWG